MFRFIARNYFSTVHAVIVTLRAMTSNNEISEQATSEKLGCRSEGNIALLPANVD